MYSLSVPKENNPVEGKQAVLMGTAAGSPDAAVSSPALDVVSIDENILKKQCEIDQYVFEQYKGEISEKGFKVTHTGPFDNYVEIGIIPYNETNADYLYKVFGRDMVKVVEGQQAVTMTDEVSGNSAELYTANNAKANEEQSTGMTLPILIVSICTLGVVTVLGYIVVVCRRKVKYR